METIKKKSVVVRVGRAQRTWGSENPLCGITMMHHACAQSLSGVQLLATPWTVACQAPPSMGFSRQEYWSGVPLPSLDSQLVAGFSGIQLCRFRTLCHCAMAFG